MIFGREWTFLCAFWEKVDFFVGFSGESGPFFMLFFGKVDIFASFLGESGLLFVLFERNWTFRPVTTGAKSMCLEIV